MKWERWRENNDIREMVWEGRRGREGVGEKAWEGWYKRAGIRTIKGTTSTELKPDVVPLMCDEVRWPEALIVWPDGYFSIRQTA